MKKMLQFYSSRYLKPLQKIVSPLENHFLLNDFTYIHQRKDGHALVIGNRPAEKEHYWSNDFYRKSPYFFHSDLFQNQTLIASPTDGTTFIDSQSAMNKKFGGLLNFLVMYFKDKETGHMFLFSSTHNYIPIQSIFVSHLSALNQFCTQFNELWLPYMNYMDPYYVNLAEAMGPKFFNRIPKLDQACHTTQKENFLLETKMLPGTLKLTRREKEFSKWLLAGKNVREIAEEMNISVRTAEGYTSKLKMDLNCESKTELFAVLQQYQRHGLTF